MNSRSVLITAAGGHIGQELIPLLLSQAPAPKLVLPTSSATLPSDDPAIVIAEGSIQNPHWMEKLVKDNAVDTVFLNLTGVDELFTTCNAFSAFQRAGSVRHLIYLSAGTDLSSLDSIRNGKNKGIMPGHVLVKVAVEQMLKFMLPQPGMTANAATWTVIGPMLFHENDLRAKESIFNNSMIPEPMGSLGCSRVSTSDIALAVLNAIIDKGEVWHGKKIMIGSKTAYTDADVTKLWSSALGRDIKIGSITPKGLDGMEEHMLPIVGHTWARDLRLMYDMFRESGFGMTAEEYDEQVQFLGREPRSYESFVEETAKRWLSGKEDGEAAGFSRVTGPA